MRNAWIIAIAGGIILILIALAATIAVLLARSDIQHTNAAWCHFVDLLLTVPVKKGTPNYQLHESLVIVKNQFGC